MPTGQWPLCNHEYGRCIVRAGHFGVSTTSSSVKKRFGLAAIAASTISKLLKKAVERGYIRVFDPDVGDRAVSYVPYWA